MSKFTKYENTRAIGSAHMVTAQASYNPSASSAHRTDLSWGALAALLAGGKPVTVAAYLEAQAVANPNNVGDAIGCLRYWAKNGNVEIAEPKAAK